LVAWQDLMEKIDSCLCAQVTFGNKDASSAGAKERMRHISMIQNGAHCYVISAIAKDRTAARRTVQDCRDDAVYVGGEVFDHNGELWVKLGNLLPIAEARPTNAPAT
jgi:hypothetical protein